MPGEVFISYSHADTDYVRELVGFLRGRGFDVWIDEGIDIGSQWIAVVRGKVDTCAAFVPVMTTAADGSTWVARELERADAFGRPILPLLLEGQPLGSIAGVQYDDVRGGRMPSARFLDRLAAVVTMVVAPEPAQRNGYDVILDGFVEGRKISVIKVVRELTGLSLAETKTLVERAPAAVLVGVGQDVAQHAKRELEAVGGRATVR